MNKRDKLEKNPIIVKYLKLLEEIDKCSTYFVKDDEILDEAFKSLMNSGVFTDTNEIYFYCGSFMKQDKDIIQVPRNSEKAEYDIYRDVESCKSIANPTNGREIFEENHKVIVFPRPFPSTVDFDDLHKDFLYTALKDGQEKACAKVLARKF